MGRLVETSFESFSAKPKYLLSFYFYDTDQSIIHAIDYEESRKREFCQGQWKIKYKENA